MYAIKEGFKTINGEYVQTFQRDVRGIETVLTVEAGTTGYTGGCSREGGSRTYLNLQCPTGDFYFKPVKDEKGKRIGFTIACCGDDGLDAFMKAITFVRDALNDQCLEIDD